MSPNVFKAFKLTIFGATPTQLNTVNNNDLIVTLRVGTVTRAEIIAVKGKFIIGVIFENTTEDCGFVMLTPCLIDHLITIIPDKNPLLEIIRNEDYELTELELDEFTFRTLIK